MRWSQRSRGFGILVLFAMAGFVPDHSQAVEFAVVGARAVGMGGAGVAVTSDAYATYWNPAGLVMSKTIDIRVGLSIQAIDRLGVSDTLEDICPC